MSEQIDFTPRRAEKLSERVEFREAPTELRRLEALTFPSGKMRRENVARMACRIGVAVMEQMEREGLL